MFSLHTKKNFNVKSYRMGKVRGILGVDESRVSRPPHPYGRMIAPANGGGLPGSLLVVISHEMFLFLFDHPLDSHQGNVDTC
jgi:hypothetical protein